VVKAFESEGEGEGEGAMLILPESRVDDLEMVTKDLEEYQPDRVISLIGRTSGPGFGTIDYLEQKGKLVENVRDNLFGPVSLAKLCSDKGIHFTYMGTGCIFTYDDEHPMETDGRSFIESDLPNYFDSSYSVVKGYTDRMMHLFEKNTLNIRIRMPITNQDNPRNFISKIIRYQKVISIPNSMTVLDELIPVMLRLVKEGVTGTVNLCNPGTIDHNPILDLYQEHVDPTFTYSNFSSEELRAVTSCGRSNNALDTSRLVTLAQRYGLKVSPIKVAVQNCLQLWQSSKKLDH